MPKFYCDYCDIHLTHDSASVRKAHNVGWKHETAVMEYYRDILTSEVQEIIDTIVQHHIAKGLTPPTFNQQGYSPNGYVVPTGPPPPPPGQINPENAPPFPMPPPGAPPHMLPPFPFPPPPPGGAMPPLPPFPIPPGAAGMPFMPPPPPPGMPPMPLPDAETRKRQNEEMTESTDEGTFSINPKVGRLY